MGDRRIGPQIDLTGRKFNKVTVIKQDGYLFGKRIAWLCKCECGTEFRAVTNAIPKLKSCGCTRYFTRLAEKVGSGYSNDRNHPLYELYQVHENMIQRCTNPKFPESHLYMGRIPPITIYKPWLESFENFYNDVKDLYKPGLMFDRRDNNGNYEPGNVRWVTPIESSQNRRTRTGIWSNIARKNRALTEPIISTSENNTTNQSTNQPNNQTKEENKS